MQSREKAGAVHMEKKVVLTGHRGDMARTPENTIPSFLSAVELGVDMIETDVHMSADGVLFLMHDDFVDRTTDGTGPTHLKTWEELRALDAGGWFSPSFAGTRIPTLEEFLQIVVDHPQLQVDWEIKDYIRDAGEKHAYTCAEKLVEALKAAGVTGRSTLNSFSSPVLEHAWEASGRSMDVLGQGYGPTNKMFGEKKLDPREYWTWACLYARKGVEFIEEDLYRLAIMDGFRTCVCIPDDEELYRQAVSFGCEQFTSNDPEKGTAILKKLNLR